MTANMCKRFFQQNFDMLDDCDKKLYFVNYHHQTKNIYYQRASFKILRLLTDGDHVGVDKRDPAFLQAIPQRNVSIVSNGREKGIGVWEAGPK